MDELLQYEFAQDAALSMLFLSVLSGIVGTYIVVRRMVFVAGGVTHASFGGIGLAYHFGLNPTLGALAFAVATAVGIDLLHTKGRVREDSAIAMLWSLGMAVGVIFLAITPGYAPNLMGFMFGDILAISKADLWAEGIAAVVVLLLTIVFYRPLLYVAFDASYARLAGWRTGLITLATSVGMALAISLAIKSVGIILVLSVFTIPQTIAGLYVNNMSKQMVLAGIISLVASISGLWMSFTLDLPTGATITALLCVALLAVKTISATNYGRQS